MELHSVMSAAAAMRIVVIGFIAAGFAFRLLLLLRD